MRDTIFYVGGGKGGVGYGKQVIMQSSRRKFLE
jgi:hypothetical protein